MNPNDRTAVGSRLVVLLVILGVLAACGPASDPASRIERARQHQANAEYHTSMIELKNALQQEPENVEARIMLGEVSLAMGQAEAAEKEFNRAAGLGAPESRIRMPLGQALMNQRAFDAVLSRFEVMSGDADQDRYEVHLLRGQAHLSLRDNEAAKSQFEQALRIKPDAARPMLGLAAIATLGREFDRAAQLIDRALQAEPDLFEAWLAKGQLNTQRGDYGLAEEAYAGALDRSKNTVNRQMALIGQAEVALAQNKTDDASRIVDTLQQVAPDNFMVGYLRGRVFAATADYQSAENELQRVLAQYPEHTASKLLLGVVSYARGNFATAGSYLSSALASDPDNVQARKLLAEIRLRLDQPEDVLSALQPALEGGKPDAVALAMSAQARLRMGEFDEGIALLERSVESDPDNRDLRIRLAASYLLAEREDEARRLLEEIPEAGDGLPRRELLLFIADIQSDRIGDADARAADMLAAQPADADLNYLIGNTWVTAGHPERARANYLQALEINPDYVSALINLARVDAAAGDLDAAESRLTGYLDGHPENVAVLAAMAQVAEIRGDREAMFAWLQRATEAGPEAPAPKLMLARYYLINADYQNAENLAQEVATAVPDNATVQQVLGLAQLGRGNHEQALVSLGKAAQAKPDSAETRYGLAVAQLAQNDVEGAAASLEKVIELQPENTRAEAMLAGLKIRSGELQEAERLIDHIESVDAESGLPQMLRGDLNVARGDDAAAALAYTRAAERAKSRSLAIRNFGARQRAGNPDRIEPLTDWLADYPEDQGVRLLLAQAHQAAGRDDEAIREYDLLVEQDNTNVVALNNLAWLRHVHGEAGAAELAARAYELQPDSGAVADTYGWILVESGEVEKGLGVLRDAVDKSPDVGEIRYHFAAALARSGEEGEARQVLTELLDSGAPFDSRSDAETLLESL